MRLRLQELSRRSGFTVSSLVGLSVSRMLAEPAIFVPLNVTNPHAGLPIMSKRRDA